jgi:hypothetical protein
VSLPILLSVITHEINKISGLQTEEYIQLVGHYYRIANGDKGDDLEGRGFSPAQIEAVRARQRATFNPVETCGLLFTRPLDSITFSPMEYALGLFLQFDRHGTLPFPGSLTDQPSKIIEIFNVLQSLRLEQESKARKAAEQNSKRNNR